MVPFFQFGANSGSGIRARWRRSQFDATFRRWLTVTRDDVVVFAAASISLHPADEPGANSDSPSAGFRHKLIRWEARRVWAIIDALTLLALTGGVPPELTCRDRRSFAL